MTEGRKLVIGWFTFTCSEDSTILLTEMLNEHLTDWKKVVEFRYFKALKSDNKIEGLDVAFVEGAISSETQEEELKKVRDNCKYLVAVGACACTGQPSASRNTMVSEEINFKIQWYLSHFDYSDKVKRVEDVVKVDDKIEGCPMDQNAFLNILDKYLKMLNNDGIALSQDKEAPRNDAN